MRALFAFVVGLGCGACGGTAASAPPREPAPKAPLVHRFEKAEEWAKIFDDPGRDAWQKPAHVMALMDVAAGSTAVDLGTGTGYFLPFLSLAVGTKGTVLALDVEPDMIRHVRDRVAREKLGNVEARVVKVDDPELPESSVDRVLAVDVWHHIPERVSYATMLARALKPGGALFVVDFTMESEQGPPKHHRLAKEKVIEELQAGGLTASLKGAELPGQYVVIGRKP